MKYIDIANITLPGFDRCSDQIDLPSGVNKISCSANFEDTRATYCVCTYLVCNGSGMYNYCIAVETSNENIYFTPNNDVSRKTQFVRPSSFTVNKTL